MTKQITRIENKAAPLDISSSSKLPVKPIYKLYNVSQKEFRCVMIKK